MPFDGLAMDQVIKNLAMKVNAAALTWAPGRQERMYYLTNTQPSTNRGMHWVAMVAEITKQGDESTAATHQPQKQPTPVSQEENMIVRRPPHTGPPKPTRAAAIFHRQGGSQNPNPWFLLGKNPPDIPTHDRAAPTDKPPAPKKETSAADGTRFGQKDPRISPAGGPRSPSMPGASGQGPSFSPSPVPQSQDFRATLETSMDMNTSSSH